MPQGGWQVRSCQEAVSITVTIPIFIPIPLPTTLTHSLGHVGCLGSPGLAGDSLACLADVAMVVLAMAMVALWRQAGRAGTPHRDTGVDTQGQVPGVAHLGHPAHQGIGGCGSRRRCGQWGGK